MRGRRQRGMLAPPGLNAGLLVSRNDQLIVFEGFPLPVALIQVEDAAGLDSKVGIARKDPTAVVPRAKGVCVEPSTNGAPGDGGNQASAADVAGNVGSVPAGERNAVSGWQLASQCFNLNDQFWGEKSGDDPGGSAHQDQRAVPRRSAFATC
jgi:hypothetical protein